MQHLFFFLAGIVLLCWPTAWVCRNRVRLLPIDNFLEDRSLVTSWFCTVVWWNLIRAWFGVWLLREAEADFMGHAARHNLVIGYNGVVQIAGLAMQMFFYRTRDNEVPFPASYVFGILLAVLPPGVALPAIALGIATSIAGRSLSIGWATAGFLAGGLGILLAVSKMQLAKAGLLFVVPLIGVLGSNRQFVIPVAQQALRPSSRAMASRLR